MHQFRHLSHKKGFLGKTQWASFSEDPGVILSTNKIRHRIFTLFKMVSDVGVSLFTQFLLKIVEPLLYFASVFSTVSSSLYCSKLLVDCYV